jgi:RND family efflux transporter MFP subunit
MSRKTKFLTLLLVIVLVGVAWWWLSRARTEAEDPNSAKAALTTAAIARVERGTLENSLTIAGAFKPFQEVDVHAKVAGYIRSIPVDVGDHVREGQTLAVLEIPELAAELAGTDAAVRRAQQEIQRAQGDKQRAESAHDAAHAMSDRLTQASQQKPGLVAQQEVDDAHAKDLEAEAQVSSAQAALSAAQQSLEMAEANQKQYTALSSYARITAPFNGVITARYADTGALIAAGTTPSAQSVPVVKIAEVSKLRLVLPIPESLASQIHLGDSVKVHVSALDTDIVGKVSRFAGALDLQTRTMETEIDFQNKDDKLYPGMYAETVLQLAQRHDALLVPLEAVAQSGADTTVLAVNPQNVVEERKVQLGLQGKSRAEVLSGLSEGDRVIIGNRSQYRSGEKVVPQDVKLPDMEKGGKS